MLGTFALYRREPHRPDEKDRELVQLTAHGPGDFPVDVMGEATYQQALSTAAGGRTTEVCKRIVDAILVLEDPNPHDSKVVQVLMGGRVCGYLSRENAHSYRKRLKKAGQPRITARWRA